MWSHSSSLELVTEVWHNGGWNPEHWDYAMFIRTFSGDQWKPMWRQVWSVWYIKVLVSHILFHCIPNGSPDTCRYPESTFNYVPEWKEVQSHLVKGNLPGISSSYRQCSMLWADGHCMCEKYNVLSKECQFAVLLQNMHEKYVIKSL